MNRIYLTLITVTLLTAFTAAVPSAYAAGSTSAPCVVSYGGYQNCPTGGNLVVNKTVMNPQTGKFVDNIGQGDAKYAPESVVSFQITVTNTGGTKLTNIQVTDSLPSEVTFNSGAGTFNKGGNMLSFTVDALEPSESKTFTITVKAPKANNMMDTVVCPVNNVTAAANGQSSTDTAQFCVQKEGGVTPVTKGGMPVFPAPKVVKTPGTGPEALPLIGMLFSGTFGLFLRKKSK